MQGVTFYNWPIKGTNQVEYNDGTGHPLPSFLGFESSWISDAIRSRYSLWVIPYWFPAFVCGIAAVLPWWRRTTWSFSLRTLLIATTLVAVVLGLAVWAAHR